MAAQVNMSHAADRTKIAIITVGLDPLTYRTLSHFMSAVPSAGIAASIDTYSGAEWEVGRAGDPSSMRVCFIDYDQDPEQAIRVTERLRTDQPSVHVFALSSYSDPERIIVAMRAGCAEYLLKPLQLDRVQEGLARVEAKQRETGRSRVRGKVITLIGAKGGTGVTSLALHLALELAGQSQRKCLLVDQHESLGDASLYLGTERHRYSFSFYSTVPACTCWIRPIQQRASTTLRSRPLSGLWRSWRKPIPTSWSIVLPVLPAPPWPVYPNRMKWES
jgi:DNA-binding NarL/FixJ family response regulator